MYTLLVGTPPFQTTDVHATYKRIRANAYEFPEKPAVSKSARDLIRWSLAGGLCLLFASQLKASTRPFYLSFAATNEKSTYFSR